MAGQVACVVARRWVYLVKMDGCEAVQGGRACCFEGANHATGGRRARPGLDRQLDRGDRLGRRKRTTTGRAPVIQRFGEEDQVLLMYLPSQADAEV